MKTGSLFICTISLFTLLFICISQPLHAQADTLYGWDFNTPGNQEGWQPTHNLSSFLVSDGTLKTTITGSDPYMNGPGGLQIDAQNYGFIFIRMRATHDESAEFFWTTTAQPNFVGGLEYGFKLIADGEFHEYQVPVGNSDKWHGTVTRLRLDPGEGSTAAVAEGAEVEIDYIRVVHLGARLNLVLFAPDREIIAPGDTIGLSLKLENTGDTPMSDVDLQLQLDAGLELLEGNMDTTFAEIAVNDGYVVLWQVTVADTGSFAANVRLSKAGEELITGTTTINVDKPVPVFPSDIPQYAQVWSPFEDHWLLENSVIRLAFVKRKSGYGPILLFTVSDGQWRQVGVIQPPGELAYLTNSGQTQSVEIFPQSVAIPEIATPAIDLEQEDTDIDGVKWQLRYHFALTGDASPEVSIRYHLSVDAERELLHFGGPVIRVGEGGSGELKSEGLFPGLEWIINDEESSSSLDVHPPNEKRYLPHPNKVTIPFMSITSQEQTTILSWDPLQNWATNRSCPSPLFASPNSWDSQNNHLMGLVVPPVGQGRDENAPLASQPYLLETNETVQIEATLAVDNRPEQLAGLKWWLDRESIPAVPEKPRTYEEDIMLNCESYMDVLWEPAELGWHMALADPWGPSSSHTIANQIWLGAPFVTETGKTEQWRDDMKALAHKLLVTDHNPGAMGWDFAFRYGELDRAWGPVKNWVTGHVAGQNEEGGWLYTGDTSLQNMEGTTLGTCAQKAYVLLRGARITGDEFLHQHGLEALEFMKQFEVPRGAQTWEVPLHAPDILAAANAVHAYVEGYRITNQTEYLDEAVRWAYAGLPFVYLWAADDRPVMKYGSIPVFGATHYTGIWFGNIVQWNGLDYAYALQKLHQYDQTLPWKQIAEGLTICGMQMQWTSESVYPEHRGMYPDAYSAVTGDETYHWDLGPGNIMMNVMAFLGIDPDVHTRILELENRKLHVNGGTPFSANLEGSTLEIRPLPPNHADSVFFLIPDVVEPQSVSFAGEDLPRVEDVDGVPEGWSYTLDGNLIVKLFVSDSTKVLLISDLAHLPETTVLDWEFNIDGYSAGWIPNFDIENLTIEQGYLSGKSIVGDPWLTSPLLELMAEQNDSFLVKMWADKGSQAQLFWTTGEEPFFDEGKSEKFSLVTDGSDHIYQLDLAGHPEWKGVINQLRFDPVNAADAGFAIDYMRMGSGTGTHVSDLSQSNPSESELLPNYPNPFHSKTTISYQTGEPCHVDLTVYNILGQKIETLVSKSQPAGIYKIEWDAGRFSGGLYFCRLETDKGSHQSQKLFLIK